MDESELMALAGTRVFERGEGYHEEGRVDLSRADAQACEGVVDGTARYRVSLQRVRDGYEWYCNCPAAEDGSFCKHLVAAALSWNDATANGEPSDPAAGDQASMKEQLLRLSAAQLADWLHEAALDDPALARRLQVRLARDDPSALRASLEQLLRVRGFLDYRRTMDYAGRFDELLRSLQLLADRDPDTVLALAERALERLFRILERVDDSGGALQERMAEFGRLHADTAARARIEPRSFARALHALKKRDEWDFLSLDRYRSILGENGWATYRARVEKEYTALPPRAPSRNNGRSDDWYAEFPILRRREELARCERDCDALIELYSRDRQSGHAYQRLVEVCREYGREAEATRWAEQGVREHPAWPGLREALAQCYLAAGLRGEAMEQIRQEFLTRPHEATWRKLRKLSGDRWSHLREELLAELGRCESRDRDGAPQDVTVRVCMLAADADLDAAVELALLHPVRVGTLHHVAEEVAESRPGDAGRLMRRAIDFDLRPTDARGYGEIVRQISRVCAIDDSDETRRWVDAIRSRYKARRKLMRLMEEAGL